MRIRLAGRRYKLVRCDISHHGECESPITRDKKIRIKKTIKGRILLDTLIHESLHACLWMADEEWVAQTASDISHILWRCGYRQDSDKAETIEEENVNQDQLPGQD